MRYLCLAVNTHGIKHSINQYAPDMSHSELLVLLVEKSDQTRKQVYQGKTRVIHINTDKNAADIIILMYSILNYSIKTETSCSELTKGRINTL
jgi:hypothetical protein